mgnify:CR=1 FL=1
MKNFLIDVMYLIFVVLIAFIVTKTNYLELIDGNINVDKFYTDIIIPICAILIRTIIKKCGDYYIILVLFLLCFSMNYEDKA